MGYSIFLIYVVISSYSVSCICDCVGSLTDSVCTTYEIHSESQSLRPGVVAAKLEENVITLDDRNSSTDTRANGGMGEAADKFSKHLLDKPEHEDESTTVLSKMCEEKSSSQMNYSSMLEGEKVSS